MVFRSAYDAADYLLIAENDLGVANFIKNGIRSEKIIRYNNAIDVDIWIPNPNKRNKFTFVCWSSAHGLRKGLPVLVAAWRSWFSGQDAELHLVGAPTIVSRQLFGDANNCEYMPGLHLSFDLFPPQHKPIVDFLGSCHVAVYPTLEDAQPSTLLEMAACGLPVITTVESGVEFTSDFCRYVIADDPSSLSEAFDFWFQKKDAVHECGNLARKYVLEHHTWGHFRKRFMSIISEASQERMRRMGDYT
jgi:glycosyltransferase involved in cell wall biosynthesis